MNKNAVNVKMLVTASVCIALSFLLSYFKLFSMPSGGSITLASMLPLMIFSWLYGAQPGFLAGIAYGLLQLIQEPYIVHPIQLILDYPLAFAMLGLAGCFRKIDRFWALPAGIALACLGRFLCHFITGVVFFSDVLSAGLLASIAASVIYNGGYMAVEAVISMALVAVPQVQHMAKTLARQQ